MELQRALGGRHPGEVEGAVELRLVAQQQEQRVRLLDLEVHPGAAVRRAFNPHLHAAEIWTVAADDLWLSPAHERDCVSIGFTWRKHPEPVHALIGDVEAALANFAARPHWGKLHRFTADDLARVFPRLPDALDLAQRHDPTGTFARDLV